MATYVRIPVGIIWTAAFKIESTAWSREVGSAAEYSTVALARDKGAAPMRPHGGPDRINTMEPPAGPNSANAYSFASPSSAPNSRAIRSARSHQALCLEDRRLCLGRLDSPAGYEAQVQLPAPRC